MALSACGAIQLELRQTKNAQPAPTRRHTRRSNPAYRKQIQSRGRAGTLRAVLPWAALFAEKSIRCLQHRFVFVITQPAQAISRFAEGMPDEKVRGNVIDPVAAIAADCHQLRIP